ELPRMSSPWLDRAGRNARVGGRCAAVFFQAEDGIRDFHVTGVQTCALPIYRRVPGPHNLRGSPAPRRRPGRGERAAQGTDPGAGERKSGGEGKAVEVGGRGDMEREAKGATDRERGTAERATREGQA